MTLEVSTVLLCDDVRQEVSGKHILVGVYTGNVGLRKLPHRFTATWWLQIQATLGKHSLFFRIMGPEDKALLLGDIEFGVGTSHRGALIIPKTAVMITAVGKIRFEWREKETDDWKVGTEYTILQGSRDDLQKEMREASSNASATE